MATKPTPGASDGVWGTEMNAFLDVSLDVNGFIKTEALQTDATAPSADAAVANKKYVDDNTTMVPAITGPSAGYAGQESVTFANGLIFKQGAEAVDADTVKTITYAVAFGTFVNSWCTFRTENTGISNACSTNPKAGETATKLNITNSHSGTLTIQWFAIGY